MFQLQTDRQTKRMMSVEPSGATKEYTLKQNQYVYDIVHICIPLLKCKCKGEVDPVLI